MSILLSLLLFFLVWQSGALIAVLLRIKSFAEIMGLGFILGTFLFTLTLLFYHSLTGAPINASAVFVVSGGITLLLSPLIPRLLILSRQSSSFLTKLLKMPLVLKIVIGILFTLVLISVIQNLFWPITDWDAMALYDFRARIVAETGSFSLGRELGYFFQYPPFTSLLHTSTYLLGFQRAKIWYSFLYGSFLLVFFALSRKQTNLLLSLFGTLALAVNPMISGNAIVAYTNLSYTMFLGLGVIYLWQWFSSRDLNSVVLGSAFVAASCWVRSSEPFWLVGVLLLVGIIVSSIQKKMLKNIILATLGIAFILWIRTVWPSFTGPLLVQPELAATGEVESSLALQMSGQITGLTGYFKILATTNTQFLWERFTHVTTYFIQYVFPVFSIYLIPSLLIIIMDIKRRNVGPVIRWLTNLAFISMIFIGTFLFSFSDSSWNRIGGSANRMSMFLIPLFIFSIFSSEALKKWTTKIKS